MPATITTTMIVGALIKAAVSVAVSLAVSALLRPKPQRPNLDTGPLASGLRAGGPKRVIFGRVGVRAARLIANERRDGVHHWVAALADWPVDAIEGVLIRGREVALDAEGWAVDDYWGADGKQTIRFRFYDGTQTEPLADMIAAGLVEAGSIGVGTAIVWVQIDVPQTSEWVQKFQGAVPDFVFRVRGAKVYDPTDAAQDRDDASTWSWAREAILVQAFHQVCPLGRGRPVAEIDWDQVAEILPRHRASITSRRGDTGPRFAADGVWYCLDETHAEIEGRIGAAHGGGLIDMPVSAVDGRGALQRFWTSDPDAQPVSTIHAEDIGPDGAALEDPETIDTRPNAVQVTFPSASRGWERYTLTVSDAAAVAADGEPRVRSLTLTTVTQHVQAATLGLVELRRLRGARSVTGSFALRHLRLRAEDHVAVDVAEWGLDGTGRWRVQASGMTAADYPQLSLALDQPEWHADAGDDEPDEIERVDVDPDAEPLPDPTVVVSSGATAAVLVGGVYLPGIKITVSGEAGRYARAIVTASWDQGAETLTRDATLEFKGGASVTTVLGPIPAGADVDWTVEVQSSGSRPAVVTGTHTVSGDLTPPGTPSSLVATGGEVEIDVSATGPADADLVELRFAQVAAGASAPDMSSVGADQRAACLPGQRVGLTLSAPAGSRDVYVAAVDSAGNVGSLAGPDTTTVM